MIEGYDLPGKTGQGPRNQAHIPALRARGAGP